MSATTILYQILSQYCILTIDHYMNQKGKWTDFNGNLHRNYDLPAKIKSNKKQWYQHGKRHRTPGPAKIIIHVKNNLNIIEEYWYLHDKQHRNNAPAYIVHDGDDLKEEWYQYGEFHRTDGPSRIIKTKNYQREEWWLDGMCHRLDGPAIILTEQGKHTQIWVNSCKFHRTDGPAVIIVDGDGNKTEEWCHHGKKINTPEI